MTTLKQFLDMLPIVADKGWVISSKGKLRDNAGRCPLCSLAKEIDPTFTGFSEVGAPSDIIGFLCPGETRSIWTAADNIIDSPSGKKVRKQLIKILNPTTVS